MEFIKGLFWGGLVVFAYMSYKRYQGRQIGARYDVSNTENQKRFIKAVELYPKNPINSEAYKKGLLPCEKAVAKVDGGHRLFAEVSLGSFIKTKSASSNGKREDRAFSSYNSKRIDFLVVDKFGKPALAIEYQGSGHYQGNATARDEVKRIALHQAGIPLYEIQKDDPVQKTINTVAKIIG